MTRPMKVSILTVFTEPFGPFLSTSLIKKALEKNLVTIDVASFFDVVAPKERIDAPTFGHGAGMLIRPDVVERAIKAQEEKHGKAFKIFFSPQGQRLDQHMLKKVAQQIGSDTPIMLISSRYEGMDARVEQEYADLVVSIGDYVLMSGDLPAMVFLEGLIRYVPGVVGREESVHQDSFTGPFVDHPEFTEPVIWHDKEVPAVIRSGNHAAMQAWRAAQAAQKTIQEHFEWFRTSSMTEEQKKVGRSCIPPHYVALMHADVLVRRQDDICEGTSSVTSLDIHDIARSARTYGLANYFIVTPLVDQQKIVQRLLDFWQEGPGVDYNQERHEAVSQVQVLATLDACVEHIRQHEGKEPLLIATSARTVQTPNSITFHDQGKVWSQNRPVLFVLGTGRGLHESVLKRCDYLLVPVQGFTDFNHLSVRSAAAVIFDRWLGWNPRP